MSDLRAAKNRKQQASQSVTVRNGETATVNFHNTRKTGSVKIVKTSDDGKVSGIQFTVKGGSVNQTVTSGADGTITVPGLVPGQYTVTESVPDGYVCDNPTQTVTVEYDKTATVNFRNTLKTGNLMRLNPNPGEYNLYIYCYRRDCLDRHMKHAERGIRFITPNYKELFRIPDGDSICINRGDGTHTDKTCRYIDEYHVEVGSGWDSIFHICQFAEQMERCGNTVIPLRSSLPEQCYVYLPTTHEIGIVKKGETGYYRSKLSPVYGEDGKDFVDEMNRSGGVTKAQAAAMNAGSMFGWATPAADPANYDEQGKLMKPRHTDRGDAR